MSRATLDRDCVVWCHFGAVTAEMGDGGCL